MNPASLSRRSLDIHNARRLQAIERVWGELAADGGLNPETVWQQARRIVDPADPFEFDLGLTFRPGKGFRLETGYNPHRNLSRDVHNRLPGLFDALNIQRTGLDDFLGCLPFYLYEITAGIEWNPDGVAKATVLMEDLHTHVEPDERRAMLGAVGDLIPAARQEIATLFDAPELCLAAADFDAEGMAGLRLFNFTDRMHMAEALSAACGDAPQAMAALKDFYQALPAAQPGELLLYYRKYDMEGRAVAAKLYYTPPNPGQAHGATDALIAAYAPAEHPNRDVLRRARQLCEAEDLSCDPVCLSMAVNLHTPADRYLALYYALGGIPYEYMD